MLDMTSGQDPPWLTGGPHTVPAVLVVIYLSNSVLCAAVPSEAEGLGYWDPRSQNGIPR